VVMKQSATITLVRNRCESLLFVETQISNITVARNPALLHAVLPEVSGIPSSNILRDHPSTETRLPCPPSTPLPAWYEDESRYVDLTSGSW
jgi:hypothetical protein